MANVKFVFMFVKGKFYPSPSNFFKIARTIFEVIIFQDFTSSSLQNDGFDLQTGRFEWPVLALLDAKIVDIKKKKKKKEKKKLKNVKANVT